MSDDLIVLKRTQFGDPVLRQVAQRLSRKQILSAEVQQLVRNMYYTLEKKKYGVGLAAPQVGVSLAISAIAIKPTPSRPHAQATQLTIINPEIIKTYGRRTGMWEGCISFCGDQKEFPYAKAMRYKKIRLRYMDEFAQVHEDDFDGLLGHVMQHETDHLDGIFFVDRVRDTTTYVTTSEYTKRYSEAAHK